MNNKELLDKSNILADKLSRCDDAEYKRLLGFVIAWKEITQDRTKDMSLSVLQRNAAHSMMSAFDLVYLYMTSDEQTRKLLENTLIKYA